MMKKGTEQNNTQTKINTNKYKKVLETAYKIRKKGKQENKEKNDDKYK